MAVEIVARSRLLFADLLSVDGVEFWDTLVLPPNPPRGDDVIHTVIGSDRIDLLAQRYYQDPVLWWVIAWANDMEILPTDLKVGEDIRIPSPKFVQSLLARREPL